MTIVLPMISGVYFGLESLVVKQSLKLSLQSIKLSVNLIYFCPALSTKFFYNKGSIVGSNSSSMFQNKHAPPLLIVFQRSLMKELAPSFMFKTLKVGPSYLFLIQLTACCWGSMQRGHLVAFMAKIPFWTDNQSDGSSYEAHLDISTSLVNRDSILKTRLIGIFLFLMSSKRLARTFSTL